VAEATAALAGSAQPLQAPNRPSLSLLGEYLKHWLPTCFGPPRRSSASTEAEASMVPKAIVAAATINFCMVVPSLLIVYASIMEHKISINKLSHHDVTDNEKFMSR
jgi:hypothetical protein